MGAFLEERLSVAVRYGARYGDRYEVTIVETSNGNEFRSLKHMFPRRRFRFEYDAKATSLYANIANTYHRAFGKYAGFRVKCLDDFTTNAEVAAPTPTDQSLALVSSGLYQLQKQYGIGGTPLAIGLPIRTLFKPVAGTVRVAVSAVEITNTGATRWTVDTTTGRVTFSADKTKAITGITKAASAVITVGTSHGFVVNDVVHVSGVSGMTQINGLRATITSTASDNITVAINSAGFSNYTSGGVVHTAPQSGEAVTAGCEFDIPARFDTEMEITHSQIDFRDIDNLELVELLNP